jgi:aldehyde dehydrogenase (NAD+)
MSAITEAVVPLSNTDRLFIGGEWVKPSSTSVIDVIDSASEEPYFQVPEAQPADMDLAIGAARRAFDRGPWPRMTHVERAGYLRAIADKLEARTADYGQMWPRESGALYSLAQYSAVGEAGILRFYADLANDYPFEEPFQPSALGMARGGFGLLVREPVGVVGAIVPWNGPLSLIVSKATPALLAGCTVIVKVSPEAPGAGYLMAEIAEEAGLPAGVNLSPPTVKSPSCWCVIRGWTRSRSRAQLRPDAGSVRSVASVSPAAPSSWVASRPP